MISSRKTSRILLLLGLVGGMAIAEATFAQANAGEQQPERSKGSDLDVIDEIERDDEAVITGKHFTYDPAGRRDPFEPLIRTRTIGDLQKKRPRGIAGMLVSEIDLKGIAVDAAGLPVALFNGSDNRGYTLRVGDPVYDGQVIAIDAGQGHVVFRQEVDDPRRIKPYRDVFKRLRPEDAEFEMEYEEEGA